MSGGGEASGITGGQGVVKTGRLGLGGDAYDGLGGRTGGEGGGYGRYGDGYGIIMWKDTVAKIILGMEPNAPLAYAYILELQYPSMSMLGGHG